MLVCTAIIPAVLYFGFDYNPFMSTIYTNIIGFTIALIIVIVIMKKDFIDEKIDHPISISKIIGWSVLGIFLAYAAQIIAVTIEIEFLGIDPESENTEIIVQLTRLNPLFLLIPAITAPILEELIFRKILFDAFYKKMHFFWAALLSSLIFGVLHMDLIHLLIYVTMGFVFAYLYVKTKRIIVPIIVHMSLNTITVLAQLLIDPEKLEQMQNELSLIFFGG